MERRGFDGDWWFLLGEEGDPGDPFGGPGWREFDREVWRQVALPHDWSIELPRCEDAPSGNRGGFFQEGFAWYRRHFKLPSEWNGKRIYVEFDGVYRESEIWINTHHLKLHPNGYTSFVCDLTPHLLSAQENIIMVRVDNSTHPHSRWYSGSGIYRHVRLIAADPVHVAHWGLAIATPRADAARADVHVETEICNESAVDRELTVVLNVETPAGQAVARAEDAVLLTAGGQTTVRQRLQIDHPALWSPDSPSLYRCHVEIRAGADVLDSERSTFGIRTFSFDAENGFVLNGKPMPMKGGCVHHDCGPLGAVALDRAEERKVELLKANGYNTVRCAHNPPSPAFLDACDRLGVMVIDEAFDVWRAGKLPHDYHRRFETYWDADLTSMIRRDRNHPSIVLWSIGNEVFERHQPEAHEISTMLSERVRALDPSRPVTAGICNCWHGIPWSAMDGVLEPLDVCGYNYRAEEYESDHARFPDRVILATESYPREQFHYWKAVERLPYVAGDFVWAAIDYLGEAGVANIRLDNEPEQQFHGWPCHHANCGDLDLCGFKRPQSYYRDVLWKRAEKPAIFVHPPLPPGRSVVVGLWGWYDVRDTWLWPGCEGRELRVDVYFECDAIELFLNGNAVGRSAATEAEQYIATFQVPYAPGEIRAVAMRGGEAVAESVLRTAGPAARIRLTPDRDRLAANPNDLSYVTVEVCDENGIRLPDADQMIEFDIQGPGRLAAVGSGAPTSTEPYRGNRRSVWRGRALAIVQPTGNAGTITVEARSGRLAPAQATIQVSAMDAGMTADLS